MSHTSANGQGQRSVQTRVEVGGGDCITSIANVVSNQSSFLKLLLLGFPNRVFVITEAGILRAQLNCLVH